jgi:hypothetical protein
MVSSFQSTSFNKLTLFHLTMSWWSYLFIGGLVRLLFRLTGKFKEFFILDKGNGKEMFIFVPKSKIGFAEMPCISFAESLISM